ncbi:MAG: amidohydrolase [Bacteroidota bacterium]
MSAVLQNLRKGLHRRPELSGAEEQTAKRIQDFLLENSKPTDLITGLGGTGVAAVYEFGESGPGILIRCELDALPIAEQNTFGHRSQNSGVSHKCGHDGHMAIVAGLASWLNKQPFSQGRVVLLFQPAEETGQGAAGVLKDQRFLDLSIDYAFALHNIPGESLHTILLMEPGFSAEVQSFALQLKGKTAHAAEPEAGINPAVGIAELINILTELNQPEPTAEEFSVLTPIHILLGEKSYGVAPGTGELHYTIRAWSPGQMQQLVSQIEQAVVQICRQQQLEYQLDWLEHFPASTNDLDCNIIIVQAATALQLPLRRMPHPFRFGEDFGWFSHRFKTGMFGLGAGKNTPALHHADYDFPDELLETGLGMFQGIIFQLLGE